RSGSEIVRNQLQIRPFIGVSPYLFLTAFNFCLLSLYLAQKAFLCPCRNLCCQLRGFGKAAFSQSFFYLFFVFSKAQNSHVSTIFSGRQDCHICSCPFSVSLQDHPINFFQRKLLGESSQKKSGCPGSPVSHRHIQVHPGFQTFNLIFQLLDICPVFSDFFLLPAHSSRNTHALIFSFHC